MGAIGGMLGQSAINAGSGIIGSLIQYALNKKTMQQGYELNEQAAQNADVRTRALYNDFMSPSARIRQLKEAGLSPSLYADGAGAGSMGMAAGAQGAGASGSFSGTMLEPAQLADIKLKQAQANEANASANALDTQSKRNQVLTEWQELQNGVFKAEFEVMQSIIKNTDGTNTSLYQYAENCDSLDDFLNKVSNLSKTEKINSELYQKTLRSIYKATKQFKTDIDVLSNESVNATFQESITQTLKNNEFPEYNAQAAIAELRAKTQTGELTTQQKGAWNNLLDKLSKKSETLRDIVIVMAMILDNSLSNWNLNK